MLEVRGFGWGKAYWLGLLLGLDFGSGLGLQIGVGVGVRVTDRG